MQLGGVKLRVGVIFGQESARLIAVRPGGTEPVGRAVAALPWAKRREAEARQAFFQAAADLLASLGGRRLPAWICLPSREAALHQVSLPPSRLDWLFPPTPPPLERLTPLPAEAVRLALRRAAPAGESLPGLGQAAVVRREVVEDAVELVREAGFLPRGLDLRAGYAGAAGLRLAAGKGRVLFMLLHQAGAEWSLVLGQRLGLVGGAFRQPGEDDADLAARACQQAIQLCGLETDFQVALAGPGAQAAAEALSQAGDSLQGPRPVPAILAGDEVLPPGLDWEELPMFVFLANSRLAPRPVFNLLPHTAASWLDRPAAAKRLAWTAAGLFALWAVLGLGGAWLGKARVQGRLQDTRARLSELRGQVRQVRAKLAGMEPLVRARQARREAAEVVVRVAALLPPAAWLERLEYGRGEVVLYVGGVAKGRLAGLLPKTGRLKPVQPLKEVSAPGTGRAAVKVVLGLDGEGKAASRTRPAPTAGPRKPARPTSPPSPPPSPSTSPPRRPLYTPGLGGRP